MGIFDFALLKDEEKEKKLIPGWAQRMRGIGKIEESTGTGTIEAEGEVGVEVIGKFDFALKPILLTNIEQQEKELKDFETTYEALNTGIATDYNQYIDLAEQLEQLGLDLQEAPEELTWFLQKKFEEVRGAHNSLVDKLQKDTAEQRQIYDSYTMARTAYEKDVDTYNRSVGATRKKAEPFIPPDYSPETIAKQLKEGTYVSGKKPETLRNILGAYATFGKGLSMLPKALQVTFAQAIGGGQAAGINDTEEIDTLLKNTKDLDEFVKEAYMRYGNEGIFGIKITDLAELPQNLSYSIISSGAGAAVGIPIALIPYPGMRVLAWASGTAVSGLVCYRATEFQITQSYLEFKNEESIRETGKPLNVAEEKLLKTMFAADAKKYALWEAVPEALSNLNFWGTLAAPLTKTVGKSAAGAILNKLSRIYLGEFSTEMITQMGQSSIEARAGMRQREPMSWTNPRDYMEALREIAPQTFLLTTVMAGAGSTVIETGKAFKKITKSLKAEVGENHPLRAVMEAKFAGILTEQRGSFSWKDLTKKEVDLLAEKAKKYKSAEEFVEAQFETEVLHPVIMYGEDFILGFGSRIEVIKNPSDADYRGLLKEFRREASAEAHVEDKVKELYDDKGNRYIWRGDIATHSDIVHWLESNQMKRGEASDKQIETKKLTALYNKVGITPTNIEKAKEDLIKHGVREEFLTPEFMKKYMETPGIQELEKADVTGLSEEEALEEAKDLEEVELSAEELVAAAKDVEPTANELDKIKKVQAAKEKYIAVMEKAGEKKKVVEIKPEKLVVSKDIGLYEGEGKIYQRTSSPETVLILEGGELFVQKRINNMEWGSAILLDMEGKTVEQTLQGWKLRESFKVLPKVKKEKKLTKKELDKIAREEVVDWGKKVELKMPVEISQAITKLDEVIKKKMSIEEVNAAVIGLIDAAKGKTFTKEQDQLIEDKLDEAHTVQRKLIGGVVIIEQKFVRQKETSRPGPAPEEGIVYRTEKAAKVYRGKRIWGQGLYFGMTRLDVEYLMEEEEEGAEIPDYTLVKRYVLPDDIKLKTIDIRGQEEKKRMGKGFKEKVLAEGYDGIKVLTGDDMVLGGDQIVIYNPEAIKKIKLQVKSGASMKEAGIEELWGLKYPRKIRKAVDKIKAIVGEAIVELHLVGSQVTGKATPKSDIDLFAEVEGDSDKIEKLIKEKYKGAPISIQVSNLSLGEAMKGIPEKRPSRLVYRTAEAAKPISLKTQVRNDRRIIKRLRDSIRKTKDNKEGIKITKQALHDYIKEMPLAIRGKMLTALKTAVKLVDLTEAVVKMDEYAEAYYRKQYVKSIEKELTAKKVASKKVRGILKGKFTPEVQRVLDVVKEGIHKSRPQALAQIEQNIKNFEAGETTDIVGVNELLNMQGIKEMTLNDLESTLDNIKTLKDTGKTLKAEKETARKEALQGKVVKAVETVTGEKLEVDEETGKPKIDTAYKTILKAKWAEKGLLNKARKAIDKIMNWQFGWDNLLDKLSALDKTSKPYESELSKIGFAIQYARINQIEGVGEVVTKLQDAFSTAYKVEGRKAILNKVAEHKEDIDLGTFENTEGHKIELILNKEQLMKKYMQLEDPTLESTFTKGMLYTDKIKDAIRGVITEEDVAYINGLREIYDTIYDKVNPIYGELYGVDLPRNPHYSGRILREGKEDINIPENLLQVENAIHYASVLNPSLKQRSRTLSPLKYNEATPDILRYILQMQHFAAFAKPLQELRGIFENSTVKAVIKQGYGSDIYRKVTEHLQDITRDGVDKSNVIARVDKIRGNLVRSILAKPIIGVKQVPSILAYMTEMPVADFFKGISNFWKNPIKNYRTLMDLSPYAKERFGKGFERDIHAAMREGYGNTLAKTHKFSDIFFTHIRMGDKLAVVQGMWAKMYSETGGKGSKASKAEMIEGFRSAERSTERTQPTYTVESLAAGQRGGSFLKLLTMFQNQLNKYYRIIADNARNFRYGRGSRIKAASNITLAWVVLPLLFQLIGSAGKIRDKDLYRILFLGPLNDILVFAQMAKSIYGWLAGDTYDYQVSPVVSTMRELQKALQKVVKWTDPTKDMTTEDFVKMVEAASKAVGQVVGMPTPYGVQLTEAVRAGDWRQILYSPYALKREEEVGKVGPVDMDKIYKQMGIKSLEKPTSKVPTTGIDMNKIYQEMGIR